MPKREIDRKVIAYQVLAKYLLFLDEQIAYHSDKTDAPRIIVHKRLKELASHIREELSVCKRYKKRSKQ